MVNLPSALPPTGHCIRAYCCLKMPVVYTTHGNYSFINRYTSETAINIDPEYKCCCANADPKWLRNGLQAFLKVIQIWHCLTACACVCVCARSRDMVRISVSVHGIIVASQCDNFSHSYGYFAMVTSKKRQTDRSSTLYFSRLWTQCAGQRSSFLCHVVQFKV